MEFEKLKKVLESLLFVSEIPLSVKKVSSFLKESSEPEILEAFKGLQAEINGLDRSFQLIEIAEGYQFVTRSQYHPFAKELYKVISKTRLSKAALEALAIIAYKQPVTRAEVEAIRGVEVSNLIQSLLEKRMIRILGRSETPGRPLLYGTTHEFLVHFGLKGSDGFAENLGNPGTGRGPAFPRISQGNGRGAAQEGNQTGSAACIGSGGRRR